MTIKNAILPALAASAALTFGSADAAPVTGGTTVIELDIEQFASVGLDIATTGSSVLDDDLLTIGITEGDVDLDPLSGIIFHDGGFQLSNGDALVVMNNLAIDLNTQAVLGSVFVNGEMMNPGTPETLFTFDLSFLTSNEVLFDLDNPNLNLIVSNQLSVMLQTVFAISFDNAVIGEVSTSPVFGDADVVPLPGAAVLFGTVALVGAARRKFSS